MDLIDKAAVVAEMKRRISNLEQLGDRKFIETHFNEQFRFIKVYEGIIDFINNLEVKEDVGHYELEEFAKIVRGNLTGISKPVQTLFEAKYQQLTGNKMYGGYKD